MACTSNKLYASLEFCKGETVIPGLMDYVYFAPKADIVTFAVLPDLSDETLTMDKVAVLKGNFALAAEKKWRKIDILDTASNVTSASQGEKPSKTFLNSSTIKFAGNTAAATGFCRMANADDLVFIIRQRDGKFRVLGNQMFSTNINPSQDSGMAVTDASGTTLEISVTDLCPAPFYDGTLIIEEGVLDCSTGEITIN